MSTSRSPARSPFVVDADLAQERGRVVGGIDVVLDELLGKRDEYRSAAARALADGFAADLARLRQFVREGGTVEAFALDRADALDRERAA